MKKKTIEIVAAGLVMLGCLTSNGETESVNGVTWTYSINESADATIEFTTCKTKGNLTIPETLGGNPVRHIKNYAFFFACTNLTSVKIPASVTDIEAGAFGCCLKLEKFEVAPDNPIFKADSGLLLTKDGKTLVAVACGLTHMTIPEGVTAINSGAFKGCINLTSVTIPANVTSIGTLVFAGCTNLENFEVSPNNTNYKTESGLLLTKDGTTIVAAAGRLTHVAIPPGVTHIGLLAFAHNSNLRKVTIPDSVTSIEQSAFRDCDEAMFDKTTIPGLKLVDGWVVGYGDDLSGSLDLTGVRGIGDGAFQGCSSLTRVKIPAGMKHVGLQAFACCDNLTVISADAGNANYSSTNGLLLSKDGRAVIKGFNGNVTIPSGVKTIKKGAFRGCSGLTCLEIPAGMTDIEPWAFMGCLDLASVTVPTSVTRIGWGAFEDCNEALYDETTFPGLQLVDGWIVGHREGLSGSLDLTVVRGIGDCAFLRCHGLTSVTIPTNVTSIGGAAFRYCNRLTSVTIPANVIRFGWYAFAGCTGLKSVTIPAGVTYIGRCTFEDCKGLSSVTIPAGVTHISDDAFKGCNLKELVVAKGNRRYFVEDGCLCDRKTGKKIRVIAK